MEETRFAIVPQIGMIGVPQVRVGTVVGHAMRLVGNHTHFCAIQEKLYMQVKIALSFGLCNFLTVTGTIILELHSPKCL